MRCLYVDLDGTLLGPGASLLRGADGRFALEGVRALEACCAGGRRGGALLGAQAVERVRGARLIGSARTCFELGCGLVIDGELEWLTGRRRAVGVRRVDLRPDRARRGRRRCCSSASRGGSSTTRRGRRARGLAPVPGRRRPRGGAALLDAAGFGWLRLVDNGVVRAPDEQMAGLPVVHAYHLIPAAASKARAVARHMQARGYAASECIAVGDSREDIEVSRGRRHVLARGQRADRDPTLGEEIAGGRACGSRPSPTAPASTRRSSRRSRNARADARTPTPATPNARYAIPTGSS